jgi:hypothetical protein
MGRAGGCHGTEGKSIHYLVGKPDDMRQYAERVDGSDGLPQTGFETRSRTLWSAIVLYRKGGQWRALANKITNFRFHNIREFFMSDGNFFSFGENRR